MQVEKLCCDILRKNEFEQMFGQLAIGAAPTPLRNSYLILHFDFSCVDAGGTAEAMKKSLHSHVNGCIEGFRLRYQDVELPEIVVHEERALRSLHSLVNAVGRAGRQVCLLIDECDNFANEVMMDDHGDDARRYVALVHGTDPLKTLFNFYFLLHGCAGNQSVLLPFFQEDYSLSTCRQFGKSPRRNPRGRCSLRPFFRLELFRSRTIINSCKCIAGDAAEIRTAATESRNIVVLPAGSSGSLPEGSWQATQRKSQPMHSRVERLYYRQYIDFNVAIF